MRWMRLGVIPAALALAAAGLVGCSATEQTPARGVFPGVEAHGSALPMIEQGRGDKPTATQRRILRPGKGAEVGPHDTVAVDYVGQTWEGRVFDHTFQETAAPRVFSLDEVIEGWREGLAGAHVGDRVQIVVPPEAGYGDKAQHDNAGKEKTIPAGSTLVFVVDVLGRIDPTDVTALRAARPQDKPAIPEGITVGGDLGTEPTLSVADTVTAPAHQQLIVLAEGMGEPIEADDYVAAHITVHPLGGGETQSTWRTGRMQVTAGPVAQSTLYNGVRVGTRALVVAPGGQASTGEAVPAAVYVIDYGAKMTAIRAHSR